MHDHGDSAPGWYPDPASGGLVRWWDGVRWTVFRDPPRPAYATGIESYAIVALVIALVGVPIVPIVLGVVARNRIRESELPRGGNGLAIAAICLSALQLLLVTIVVLAVVSGVGASG